jgi:cystathionine beta-lyase
MSNYNFDKVINRFKTDSIRWDQYDPSVIPLWVADMDFESPPCVLNAMKNRVEHGIFGYTHAPNNFKENIADYVKKHYDWEVDPDWIVIIPSVVSALYSIGISCTKSTSHIITPQPIYHHLKLAAEESGRNFDEAQLETSMNRQILSQKSLDEVVNKNSELLYFCNPHNPGGTVYKRDELIQVVNFCNKNNLVICSDEIHAGMVLDGHKHIPIASISETAANRTITLMSLNKTFNFPGAGLGWMICKNRSIREKASHRIGSLIPHPEIFGYVATDAAIKYGEEWRIALLHYLSENRKLLIERINQIPGLRLYDIEASYLGWISCESLPIKDPHKLFLNHGVALQPGYMFNQPNHVRINIATTHSLLKNALDRIEIAVKSI